MDRKYLLDIAIEISNDAFLKTNLLLKNINIIDDPVNLISLYHGLAGLALLEADIFCVTKNKINLDRAKYYIQYSLGVSEGYGKKLNSGLFIGNGGIVWSQCRLIDANKTKTEEAKKLMKQLSNDEKKKIISKMPINDIIYGDAGKGLILLKKYKVSNEKSYLSSAYKIAENIIHNRTNNGLWISEIESEKAELLSFSHGASGIAYFLYEVFAITKESRFEIVVKKIINLLIEKEKANKDYVVWQNDVKKNAVTPYWCSGTSGIGLLFARAHKNIGDYSDTLNKMVDSVILASNGSNTYGLCHGLAGIGEFIIETEYVLKISFKEEKEKILSLILSEYLNKTNMTRNKLTNPHLAKEFMTGYPGIAHFIIRYLNPSVKHFSLL